MSGPTGYDERLVPDMADSGNLSQHLKRYQFALAYCEGRTVVDSGSGVGYGTEMLASVAEKVYGVDYDPDAIAYATGRYRSPRLTFLVGDVNALPLRSGSADVVTSLEVLEHVPSHELLLSEVCRILKPAGTLIISTPNTTTTQLFRRTAGLEYPAHVSEVDLATFRDELRRRFAHVRILGMRFRGNALYTMVRALDRWNLRLRVLSTPQIQFARERVLGVPQSVSVDDIVVSRWNVRQANHFLAVCSVKKC